MDLEVGDARLYTERDRHNGGCILIREAVTAQVEVGELAVRVREGVEQAAQPGLAYYLLLTTHYSLLATYHLPLTPYHLPLTTYPLPRRAGGAAGEW